MSSYVLDAQQYIDTYKKDLPTGVIAIVQNLIDNIREVTDENESLIASVHELEAKEAYQRDVVARLEEENVKIVKRADRADELLAVQPRRGNVTGTVDLVVAKETRFDVADAFEKRIMDEAIRADCELFAAWEDLNDYYLDAKDRKELLAFVLNRRQVVEWPAWAGQFVDRDTA